MKQLIYRLVAITLLFTVLLAPASALAWTPFGGVDCSGDAANSAVCKDATDQRNDPNNTNPLTGVDGIIMQIVNLIAIVAGAAAVIIIILAGLRLIQSGGNTEDVAGARRSIIYAIVGIIIIIIARTLVVLVVKGL